MVALARSQTPELVALVSDDLLIIECDVTNDNALTDALSRAEKTYHHIDGLILNAGVLDPLGSIGDNTTIASWRNHFDVNFFSHVTALKATLPSLRQSVLGARVIFISSGSAVKGPLGMGPYNASKAAVNSLCRTLGNEEPSIVSVALRPGMVDTDMQSFIRGDDGSAIPDVERQRFISAHKEGKLVRPEIIGNIVAALVLKATKDLNGQFISWDSEECKPYRDER